MTRILLSLAFLAVCMPAYPATQFPCVVALDTILVNIDGYTGEVRQKLAAGKIVQPYSAITQCIRTHGICLLLAGKKVISAKRRTDVNVATASIWFGIDQTRRTKNRRYCSTATLVPEIGGTYFWAYRTFLPNGGWLGDDSGDSSDKPKTSDAFFLWTSRSFEDFLLRLTEELSSPNFAEGDGGFRKGESP